MLAFSENKKGGSSSVKKRDHKWEEKKADDQPAWHDAGVEKLQVHIDDKSRLRKLKRQEAETHISGEQYAERL